MPTQRGTFKRNCLVEVFARCLVTGADPEKLWQLSGERMYTVLAELLPQDPSEKPVNGNHVKDFEEFWKAYPQRVSSGGKSRKVGKPKAKTQYAKQRDSGYTHEHIMAQLTGYILTTEPQYIKDAHRWLRDNLDDEYQTKLEEW